MATTETTVVSPSLKRRFMELLAKPWSGVAMLLVFYLILIAVFSILSPFFFNTRNMLQIGLNVAYIGLMAAAGTPLIIAGGLDLSVAAIAGLTGVMISLLVGLGVPVWVAVGLALALAAAIGVANGLFTTRLKLNPLITTLGMMSIVSGIALVLTGGLTRPLMIPGFNWIGSERLFSIPIPLIIMVVTFFALWLVMTKTKFGRFIYAAGGNAEASRLIGIPVERTVIVLYVISALAGAVAGTILGAMLGAAGPNAAGLAAAHRHRRHHPRRHQPQWRARFGVGHAPRGADPGDAQQWLDPAQRIELLAGCDARRRPDARGESGSVAQSRPG